MQTEQKFGVVQVAEGMYDKIFNDPRVQAALAKIRSLLNHPEAPFIAFMIGTSATAATLTFVIVPLVGFANAGVAAGSAAAAIQSAVYGGSIPAGSVFSILQSLGATGSVIPALVVGTVSAGCVAAVRLLGRTSGRKEDVGGKLEAGAEGEEGDFENEGIDIEGEGEGANVADGESPSQAGDGLPGKGEGDVDMTGSAKEEQQAGGESATMEARTRKNPVELVQAVAYAIATAAQNSAVQVQYKVFDLTSRVRAKL